ncbi:hypothetical protein SNE40_005025 [Patella caerulea]|uniref:HAT C-terminal dimerisation domain-containing protein n=1 Tax=Patella caerulea TaxID=87958 RepID=A0AAN8KDE3_PATCE
MLRRLLELRLPVYTVIFDESVTKICDRQQRDIRDSFWKIIEEIVPVLQPLADATELLAVENSPSSTCSFILVSNLVKHDLNRSDGDSDVVCQLKQIIINGLFKRLPIQLTGLPNGIGLTFPWIIATALDPKYKSLRFLPEAKKSVVFDYLRELLLQVQQNSPPDPETELPEPVSKLSRVAGYISGDFVESSNSDDDELTHFCSLPVKTSDSLGWWCRNQELLPKLNILARNYLGVPATSFQANVYSVLMEER